MDCHLRIPGSAYDELEELFREAGSSETGAFLLVGHSHRGEATDLLVRQVLRPPASAWRLQEELRLAPSTAWMSEAIGRADEHALSLAFIHSHPGPLGFSEFSLADEWMHEQLVPVMVDNLDGRVFGSFVYSRSGVAGALWREGRRLAVRRVSVVGRRYRRVHPESTAPDEVDADEFSRQVQLWGPEGQRMLGRLRVGIVGVGGTGSAVADQLARLGIGSLVLVDHDVLEASNVSRVIGSTADDIGKSKVSVVGHHVARIRGTAVEALQTRVETAEAISALKACDVVFGCTDSHGSRAFLNDLAVQYLLPLVDVGCRVYPAEGRTLVPVETRVVVPDGPCLWCMSNVLDGRRIREERLLPEERAALEAEGYVNGLTAEPSVVPVTTATSSIGVLQFMGLVLGTGGQVEARLVGDLGDLDFMALREPKDPGCTCGRNLALGDVRPLVL